MKFLVAFVTILIVGTVSAFAPTPYFLVHPKTTMATTRWASSTTEEYYIDNQRRSLMNLLMVGTGGLTVVGFGLPFILFFYPQGAGSGSSTTVAQDALGKEIFAKDYLASKPANDRSLVQGLKGDPTYLIVKEDKQLENYGLNAICTHLGCVVPWVEASNKFICPCHASQYSPDGTVIRGPAPLPLALAHCDVSNDGKITFSAWVEDDFRTGNKAWWN